MIDLGNLLDAIRRPVKFVRMPDEDDFCYVICKTENRHCILKFRSGDNIKENFISACKEKDIQLNQEI